jgi:hypothetical protein
LTKKGRVENVLNESIQGDLEHAYTSHAYNQIERRENATVREVKNKENCFELVPYRKQYPKMVLFQPDFIYVIFRK